MAAYEGARAAAVEGAVRAAAKRLAAEHGPRVVEQVEGALCDLEWGEADAGLTGWRTGGDGAGAHGDERAPGKYFPDPIALGSFIVSVATLAWTVYWDLARGRRTEPAPAPVPHATVTLRVRMELEREDRTGLGELSPAQRERLVEVVVEEVLRAAPPAPPEPGPGPQHRPAPAARRQEPEAGPTAHRTT
ncbi:hypothetical protein LG634_09305 [Streptomyces bambusae]|uniref:hypothetical protein n=1 Tax=Streptomyces bambusae TaxID=1550616 RepID=UPI001CFCC4FB|nr:hypothetical protein [Streptomyces bambusae]MCB5165023.1 hypothetical protein [Streptomyces bambusae]